MTKIITQTQTGFIPNIFFNLIDHPNLFFDFFGALSKQHQLILKSLQYFTEGLKKKKKKSIWNKKETAHDPKHNIYYPYFRAPVGQYGMGDIYHKMTVIPKW